MSNLVLPQVAFAANYEEDIKETIFNAMDCQLWSNRKFGSEKRWFSEFPEFVLKKEPTWNDKNVRKISNDFGVFFDMSIERINALYTHIRSLFPNGQFTSYHKYTYDITVHQIFRLGTHVWANAGLQSVFYCAPPVLTDEYEEWSKLATCHDYTYMMSDSSSTHRAGHDAEKRLAELQAKLDNKTCVLWYNYILGRMRTRPQDGSFGIHTKDVWNTPAEAYLLFNMNPTVHPEVAKVNAPENKPCHGFPVHPRKQGWVQGDWNMEYYYSGSRPITYEEYLEKNQG